jgi:hypothetical protein
MNPNNLHRQEWAEAVAQYGSPFRVPRAVAWHINERTRARWALETESGASALKTHAIASSVIEALEMEVPTLAPKPKRADKWRATEQWCKEHTLEQVTPDQLAEITGFSRTTVLKFIQDRVDLFRKVKWGIYEVRDAEGDRAREKGAG